jgi:RNase H-like domain found in reverse transcriptase
LAFHDVKKAYTAAPVLKIADAALDYVVTTDASDVGIGTVLEQEYDDGLHPVAYASRKLNSAEQTTRPTITNFSLLYTLCASGERTRMARGSEFAVITTRFSTWKPNPNFPNDKSDQVLIKPDQAVRLV